MFVAEELRLPFEADVARARLLTFLQVEGLQESTEDAFDAGCDLLVRAGVGVASRQILVQVLRPYVNDDVTILPLRWVATGATGAMFPQLDGNLELAPAGDDASILRLNGAYRPPLSSLGASLDRLLLNRVADATARRFLKDIATGMAAVPDDGVPSVLAQPTGADR